MYLLRALYFGIKKQTNPPIYHLMPVKNNSDIWTIAYTYNGWENAYHFLFIILTCLVYYWLCSGFRNGQQ